MTTNLGFMSMGDTLKNFLRLCWVGFAVFAQGCETAQEAEPQENDALVVIENFAFSPQELTVSPGQTVFFVNNDDVPHHIFSEAEEDAFESSGDFESDVMTAGQTGFVEIPNTAQSGDVFFYYCGLIQESMATPSGSFVVD